MRPTGSSTPWSTGRSASVDAGREAVAAPRSGRCWLAKYAQRSARLVAGRRARRTTSAPNALACAASTLVVVAGCVEHDDRARVARARGATAAPSAGQAGVGDEEDAQPVAAGAGAGAERLALAHAGDRAVGERADARRARRGSRGRRRRRARGRRCAGTARSASRSPGRGCRLRGRRRNRARSAGAGGRSRRRRGASARAR